MAELVLCDGLECKARTLDRGVVVPLSDAHVADLKHVLCL